MAQYLVYPTGSSPLSGTIFSSETLTGLTGGTGYTIHKLSSAGTFTTAAAAVALTNQLVQVNASGVSQASLIGATLVARTASVRVDTEGVAAASRATHIPTAPALFMAEVSKTGSGNRAISVRTLGGTSTDITRTLRIGETGQVLATANIETGNAGVVDRGDSWRLWIRVPFPGSPAWPRYMMDLNVDAQSQSWGRAALVVTDDPTIAWVAP